MKSLALSIGWLVKPTIAPVCDGVGIGVGDDGVVVDWVTGVCRETGLDVAVDVGFAVGVGGGPLFAP